MKKVLIISALVAFAMISVNAQKIQSTSFGKGINFMAKDSSMTMKMHFRMQNLYDVQHNLTSNSSKSNFLIRRSRLKFSGYAFSPKLKYKAELGLSNRDISTSSEDGNTKGGGRIILDAVLKYKFQKHWELWVGQTKLPGNRERVVSSANLQFVDRSLVNSKFNVDRDMGLQIHGKYKLGNMVVRPKFAFSKGEGRDITTDNLGGFCYTGRLDLLPMGEFEGKKQDYILSDITRQSKPKLAIGISGNYNDRAVRQQGQLGKFVTQFDSAGNELGYAENSLYMLEADLLFKVKGFSTLIEFANTSAQYQLTNTDRQYNTGTGFNAQMGYLFENNFEVAGRFTGISADNNLYSGITATDEYTLAVSRYFVGHSLKVQSDISYIQTPGNETIRFRAQMEMQF